MAPQRRLLSASLGTKLPWTNADKMEGELDGQTLNHRRDYLVNFDRRKRGFCRHSDTIQSNENRLDINQVTKCVFLGSLCLKPLPQIFDSPQLLEDFQNKLWSDVDKTNEDTKEDTTDPMSNPSGINESSSSKKSPSTKKDEVIIKEENLGYDYYKPPDNKIAQVNIPHIKTDGSSPVPIYDDDPIDDSSNDSFAMERLANKVYINEMTGLAISPENIKGNRLELLMPYENASIEKASESGEPSFYPKGVRKFEDHHHYSDEDLENDIMYISVDKETYDFYENVSFGDGNEDASRTFNGLAHNEISANVKLEYKEKVEAMALQDNLEAKQARTAIKKLYKRSPQCKICNMAFSNYRQLKKHKTAHDGENPYVCPKCGENHNTLEMLLAHLRTHQGKRPHVCKKCTKGFKTLEALEAHQPVHVLKKVVEPKKMFKCEECGKEFRKLCDLERHTRVHTGEKPCVCNICNRGFQQAHNLNKHLLIHTQEKPYQCDICQKRFGRNDVLNRHLLTHAVTKPNTCEYCSKSFIRATQLLAHIEKHHTEEPQIMPQLL